MAHRRRVGCPLLLFHIGLIILPLRKTYDWFLSDCHESGPYCALSHPSDTSPVDIRARIQSFLEQVNKETIPVSDPSRPGVLTDGIVRNALHTSLQVAAEWVSFADALALAMSPTNASALPLLRRHIKPFSLLDMPADEEGYTSTGQGPLGRLAISCGDARPYGKDEAWPSAEYIVEGLLRTLKVSPTFGATVHMTEQHGGCQFWPSTGMASERFAVREPVVLYNGTCR